MAARDARFTTAEGRARLGFLAGGGEMGARIRAHDWSASPLGEPAHWPQGLKTAVRILLSTGHPMFLFWGPDLIQFYNDAYRRSIGPERHPSALGQRGRECWEEIWDTIGPQIEQVMAGEGYTWHENQLVPITRHGRREEVYWTYSYGPVDEPTAPHGVGGVLVVCTETTEQVLTAKRLEEADHKKDEFLAMLAHELRNPLAAIRNASELLILDAGSHAPTRGIGELLSRQVEQLSRLVDDLLDVSRITRGHIELVKAPVEVRSAIARAVESVHAAMAEKEQRLRVACAEGLYVEADMVRLVQALSNVLGNAAKFTPPGGRIDVSVEREDGMATIRVSDDGFGISAAMLPHVFDLFSQDRRTLDRAEGGLGIGLALVERLIAMHGGRVEAASDGVSRGSTFTLRLPSIEPPEAEEDPGARTAPAPRRVLVVDDNVDAADSLARLLRSTGHEAEAVYSAEEALRRAEHAEVVILDIGLPRMDGYQLAKRIRARANAPRVIALTGYGQPADVQRSLEAGFDVHLTKPVDLGTLQGVLGS